MYISVDVGGTNMRVALVDLSGEAEILKLESQRINQSFAAGIIELGDTIERIADGNEVAGIGMCFPGIIGEDDMITTANNLPDWENKPIRQTLEERFQTPFKMVHDAQGGAIGEALFGAAKGRDRFVYFIWGTGIGASDIKQIDERRYFMFSFENGHYITDWEGKACNCGQRGCPEAELGGDMLREYFGTDMEEVSDSDPRWDPIISKAAQVVINTLVFHPVDLFVFSGGVISRRPFLLDGIREIMQERLFMFPLPEMVLSAKGDKSALYGCAGAFLIDLV